MKLGPWIRDNTVYRRRTHDYSIHVSVWQSTVDGLVVIAITDKTQVPEYEEITRVEPSTMEDALKLADEKLIKLEIPFAGQKTAPMI